MRFFSTFDARDERISEEASRLLGRPVRVVGYFSTGSLIWRIPLVHGLLGFPTDRVIACTDDTIVVCTRSYFGRVNAVKATYPILTTDVVLEGEMALRVGGVLFLVTENADYAAARIADFCTRHRLAPDWTDMRPCPSCGRESPAGRDACGWCGLSLL